MRFLKLQRVSGGDILHVWIEDGCPTDIEALIRDSVIKLGRRDNLIATDRRFTQK